MGNSLDNFHRSFHCFQHIDKTIDDQFNHFLQLDLCMKDEFRFDYIII